MESRFDSIRDKEFNIWCNKVKLQLPIFVKLFYEQDNLNKIHYSYHKLLGDVISDINNPSYSYTNNGEILNKSTSYAYRVILKINVKKLFKIISKEVIKNKSK